MMTYSYKCNQCNQEFEIRATLEEKEKSSPDKFRCPHCGSTEIIQTIKACNFVKGSGEKDSQINSCPTGTCPFV
jgi:putative FmdB family regulatory protein